MKTNGTFMLGLLGAAASLLGGCGSTPSVPLESFCQEYATAYCAGQTACACAPVTDCEAMTRTSCGTTIASPEVVAAVGSGTLRYNASVAGSLISRVRSGGGCTDGVSLLGPVAARDFFTSFGLFSGTVPNGSACEMVGMGTTALGVSTCREGLCQDTGGSRTCVATAALGGACSRTSPCLNLDAPLAVVNGGYALNSDIYCDSTGTGSGVCRATQGNGSACSGDAACASGVCTSGACAPKKASGAACGGDSECASGLCDATCMDRPNKPKGAACMNDSECATNSCTRMVCAAAICAN